MYYSKVNVSGDGLLLKRVFTQNSQRRGQITPYRATCAMMVRRQREWVGKCEKVPYSSFLRKEQVRKVSRLRTGWLEYFQDSGT